MIVGCTIMRLACLFTPKTTEWNWVGPLFCTYAKKPLVCYFTEKNPQIPTPRPLSQKKSVHASITCIQYVLKNS